MPSKSTEKRLEAIEGNPAIWWGLQSAKLRRQIVDAVEALQEAGHNPGDVLDQLTKRTRAGEVPLGQPLTWEEMFRRDAAPVLTHDERRRRIIELLDMARERRDEAMQGGEA